MNRMAQARIYNNKSRLSGALRLGNEFLWRAVPFLIFFAVFAPILIGAYHEFSSGALPLQTPKTITDGETFFRAILLKNFGETGLKLFSIVPSAIMMFAIFKITKLFDAPIWARAIAASLIVVLPLFNLAPNLWERPDDALFAALCVLMAYNIVCAIKTSSQLCLGVAFTLAIIITFLRPISFWPQILIFLIARFTSNDFKSDAKYGLVTSLIWGPGLFMVLAFLNAFKSYSAINSVKMALSDMFKNSMASDAAGNAINFIGLLPAMLPFVILLALGLLGLVLLLTNENRVKKHYYAAAIILLCFVGVAVLGGGLSLTRLLLDPILIALAAAITGFGIEKLRAIIAPFKFNIPKRNANSSH